MNSTKSNLTILTLDAGGTNFVFSAIIDGNLFGEPFHLPASTKDKNSCSQTIIKGFEVLIKRLNRNVDAISFAFPGPANYQKGIIGDLPNFTGLNGNYPLKAILENHFKIPVFINNDGNLFSYGEALEGVLPNINNKLKDVNSPKRYKNLIGITLGTGIGSGIVLNGLLLLGDNSCEAEIHNMTNLLHPDWNIEESVSTRAIQRVYAEKAGIKIESSLMPRDIYSIAKGNRTGNRNAAIDSFKEYGKSLGYAITNILTLIDGIVVLGGGITASWDLFSPTMFDAIRSSYCRPDTSTFLRTNVKVFNLEDKDEFNIFLQGDPYHIIDKDMGVDIRYDKLPRTGIILSRNGASVSTSLGAYHFAKKQLTS